MRRTHIYSTTVESLFSARIPHKDFSTKVTDLVGRIGIDRGGMIKRLHHYAEGQIFGMPSSDPKFPQYNLDILTVAMECFGAERTPEIDDLSKTLCGEGLVFDYPPNTQTYERIEQHQERLALGIEAKKIRDLYLKTTPEIRRRVHALLVGEEE